MDATLFVEYFSKLTSDVRKDCPVLHIPGKTFPVTQLYLDELDSSWHFKYSPKGQTGDGKDADVDYDSIASVVVKLCGDGQTAKVN